MGFLLNLILPKILFKLVIMVVGLGVASVGLKSCAGSAQALKYSKVESRNLRVILRDNHQRFDELADNAKRLIDDSNSSCIGRIQATQKAAQQACNLDLTALGKECEVQIAALSEAIDSDKSVVVEEQCYPWSEIPEAIQRVLDGSQRNLP